MRLSKNKKKRYKTWNTTKIAIYFLTFFERIRNTYSEINKMAKWVDKDNMILMIDELPKRDTITRIITSPHHPIKI